MNFFFTSLTQVTFELPIKLSLSQLKSFFYFFTFDSLPRPTGGDGASGLCGAELLSRVRPQL